LRKHRVGGGVLRGVTCHKKRCLHKGKGGAERSNFGNIELVVILLDFVGSCEFSFCEISLTSFLI